MIQVAAAAVVPMALGYIGDTFAYEGRQIALARFMSALMIGQIAGSTLGGLFGQYLGWRYIFIVFGIVSVAVSTLLAYESRRFPEASRAGRRLGWTMLAVPVPAPSCSSGCFVRFRGGLSTALEALGVCLLIYAVLTQYGGMLKRHNAPLVLGTVLLEGLFVFGGLAYLASSLTDRFGINYASAGLMVAGFGVGGLACRMSVKKLVNRIGELGIVLLGGTLLGVPSV